MDKRGMGVTDYNGMVTKPLGCRPPPISKESSMDRPTFLDKVISAWCTSQSVHSVEMLMIFTVCLESVEGNVMDMTLFLFCIFSVLWGIQSLWKGSVI